MTQALDLPFAMTLNGGPFNLSKVAEVPLASAYAARGWRKYAAPQGPRATLLGYTLHGSLVWMQVHNLDPVGPAIVVQTAAETAVVDRLSGWAWYDRTWLANQVTAAQTPADYNLQFSDGADAEDVKEPADTGSAGIDFESWEFCFALRDGWSWPALSFAAEWLAIQIKRPGSGAMTSHGAPLSWSPGTIPLTWGTHQANAAGYARKDEHHFDVQEAFHLARALGWPMAADSLLVDVALGVASFPSWKPSKTNTYYGNPRVPAHAMRALANATILLQIAGEETPPSMSLLVQHLARVAELVMADEWFQPWWTGGGHAAMKEAETDFWTPWQYALLAWVLQELSERPLPDDLLASAGYLAELICTKLNDEAWDPQTGTVWDDISFDGGVKVPSDSLESWLLPAMRRWAPQHPLVHLLIAKMDPKQFVATAYAWRYGARALGVDVELGQAELLAQSAEVLA